MKKGKVINNLKRILISIMCVVTLVFAMPLKAKADVIEDFVSLIAYIADIPMIIGNIYLDPYETDLSTYDFNTKGVNLGLSDEGWIRNFSVSPYDIFTSGMKVTKLDDRGNPIINSSGEEEYYIKLPIFDSNFFSDDFLDDGYTNSAELLRPVIGNIYKQLRNLALVLMMLVLLYIGIKIIISSAAAEQAKYKQWLVDWLVGLSLLFIMHYIMSFLMNVNEIVLNMLKNDEGDSYYISLGEQGNGGRVGSDWVAAFEDAPEFAKLHLDIPDQNFESGGNEQFPFDESTHTITVDTRTDWGDNGKVKISAEIYKKKRGDKDRHRAVYKANLLEYVRTVSDYGSAYLTFYNNNAGQSSISEAESEEDKSYGDKLATEALYVTLYVILVVESIMFAVTYIKRVFQLALLTMIAPLVSFMYPIDKVGDGKAQAFNTWFKDYMFNVLIQPLHLLLYTIFVSAARDLFSSNLIYAIAIYGMMLPAEKYFKKIFGFDKASTGGGGALAGAMGAGLGMRAMDRLTGLGPPGGGGKGGSGGSKGSGDNKKPRLKKNDLPNSGGNSNPPSSGSGNGSGSRGGSGSGGASGPGGGSGGVPSGPGRTGGRNSGSSGGSRNTPNASGNNSKTPNPLAKMAKRHLARAVTGGKYDTFKGIKGRDIAGAIAGNYGRKIGRTAMKAGGRALGLAVMGGAGLMAGTVSAVATGNVNDIAKGVSVGAAAGWNRGGQFGDWISDNAGELRQEYKETRAEDDEEYNARLRVQQARMDLQGSNLEDEQLETVDKYAPYVNFDGDEDKAAAFHELDQALSENGQEASIEDVVTLSKLAVRYGNINEGGAKEEALRKAIEANLIENVQVQNAPSQQEITKRSDELKKQYDKQGETKTADELKEEAKQQLEYEDRQRQVKDKVDKRLKAAKKYYNDTTK